MRARTIPFESGVSPGPPQKQRFTVSFYLTAMLFILFDIEIVFLYPLAVILHELGWFGFVEFLFFLGDPRWSRTSTSGGRERSNGGRQAAHATTACSPSACSGRTRGPGKFEDEVAEPRGEGRADDAREGGRLGADEVDVARHVRARVLRDRDDVDRLVALRHRALRDGGVPLLAAPGRPADRLRPRRRTRWPRRCARSTTRCSSRSG